MEYDWEDMEKTGSWAIGVLGGKEGGRICLESGDDLHGRSRVELVPESPGNTDITEISCGVLSRYNVKI